MIFVEAVNRVLRSNGILSADDVDVTFNDVAHRATVSLAKIAIQDEVNDLVSDNLIPYEVTTGQITTTASTAVYDLPADFVRFFGDPARLYYSTGNREIFEFTGGLDRLSLLFPRFDVEPGEPHYWYLSPTTTKRLGFYQVPIATQTYTFRYEKSVSVAESGDTMPFHTEPEAQTFCQAAGRRFKAMFEESSDAQSFILKDPSYTSARTRLINLMKGRNPYSRYGAVYR